MNLGSVVPVQGTELTGELAGKVVEINFSSGGRIAEGDVLVRLDTSREKAQLKALTPQLRQARSDQARAKKLIVGNAISEEAYEEAFAEVDRLQAQIDEQLAIIGSKRVVAPFAGKLGIRKVSLGQYIQPGTAVVDLQQIEPIFVDFDVPERDAGKVDVGQTVMVEVAAFPNETFEGTVTAVTPLIRRATRSFTVRAEFANKGGKLRPGMFADVTVQLPNQRTVVTVPDTAIDHDHHHDAPHWCRRGIGARLHHDAAGTSHRDRRRN